MKGSKYAQVQRGLPTVATRHICLRAVLESGCDAIVPTKFQFVVWVVDICGIASIAGISRNTLCGVSGHSIDFRSHHSNNDKIHFQDCSLRNMAGSST